MTYLRVAWEANGVSVSDAEEQTVDKWSLGERDTRRICALEIRSTDLSLYTFCSSNCRYHKLGHPSYLLMYLCLW